jgi:hypothetical protein
MNQDATTSTETLFEKAIKSKYTSMYFCTDLLPSTVVFKDGFHPFSCINHTHQVSILMIILGSLK